MTFLVHIIYSTGRFEDRYVQAADAAEAVAIVKSGINPRDRRWARFVV